MGSKKEKEFLCTLFSSCLGKQGVGIDIFKWLRDIQAGTDKTKVDETRQFFKCGDTKNASESKRQLRTIVPTGFMPNGRNENDEIILNGLCMVDIDIHDFDWSLAAMKKLEDYPGIVGMHRTVRGGLRIFIYMSEGITRENFKFMENVILEEIDFMLGCKHDTQATTISHLSSTSYDPETFIANKATLQPFPYEKALSRIQKGVYKELNGEVVPKSQYMNTNEPEQNIDQEIEASFDEVMGKSHKSYTKTELDNHLTRFIGRCPMEKGMRNKNLLHLGQYAHFMRYNAEEFDYIVKTITFLINDPEYNTKSVRERLCWGYRHNDKQIDLKKIAKQDFKGETNFEEKSLAHLAHLDHNETFVGDELLQQSDFERKFRQTVEEFCPYIPTTVYEKIPNFFLPLLSRSPNRRDIDISLLGVILATGSAMPKLTVQCREANYSTNFYCLCIGPAASGKSAATKAILLLKEIDAEMKVENLQRQEAFERQIVLWELERKRSFKENRLPNWDKKPKDEPCSRKILAESQTSRSKLVTDLANNPEGLFMFTSELNTLNESLHSQSGHHNAELAKIAMNEPVGISYKNDKYDIKSYFPKLTIFATGTPNQYVDFIGQAHEGMESRAFTILTTSSNDWMSWGEAKEGVLSEINQKYDEAARYLYRVYKYLEQSPTHVTVPEELRLKCDKYFKFYFKRLKDEKLSSLDSIVKRCPIMIARICGILCGLRKYEMGLNCYEMEASEDDVEIALKTVVTLMQHTFMATTMIVGKGRKINAPHSIFTRESLLKKLPAEFSTNQFMELCITNYNLSVATIKRNIKKWIEEGYIVRLRQGVYAKTKKTEVIFQ